jgi:pyruvate kinase
MWKRTKIVATVGPASATEQRVAELIEAGVDVFRINFSHGTWDEHEQAIKLIRTAEQQAGRPIAVYGDLCGPKIRVGTLQDGRQELVTGQTLVIQRAAIEGDAERFSTTLPELVDVVCAGESILLADGRIRLEVTEPQPPDQIVCRVVVGGTLSNGKGVNLPQTQLNISALTEKDLADLDWISARDFDYVALSFVQRAEDVRQLRTRMEAASCNARIIAKIEKPQALNHIDEIIDATDAVMVARGDLGVEMDFPSVPITQKKIAHLCEKAGKPCIIATEMLESMITSSRPTRAEVSDVANAVFDHADAVMLSAESAIGQYPVAAVNAMRRTVMAADRFQDEYREPVHLALHQASTTAALTGAIDEIIEMQPVAAVAVFTVSGMTAQLLAKNRPSCPILALSSNVSALRRCCLYHGVMPHLTETPQDFRQAIELASRVCTDVGIAQSGDRIIVLAGHPFDVPGNTNGLVVMTV